MVDSPDGAQAPQQTPLDAERAKLRAAGYTESEVSQILIARAVAPAQAASGGAGGVAGQQGVLSGALANFSTALKTIQNALPNVLLDLRNIFAAGVAPAKRAKAASSLAIKALLVGVVGYAIAQEWKQHIVSGTETATGQAANVTAQSENAARREKAIADKARADACLAEVEAAAKTMIFTPKDIDDLNKHGGFSEEFYQRYPTAFQNCDEHGNKIPAKPIVEQSKECADELDSLINQMQQVKNDNTAFDRVAIKLLIKNKENCPVNSEQRKRLDTMKAEIDASSERIKVIASLALTLRYKEDAEKEFAAGHYDAAYETIRKARETSEKLETKQLGKPGKATATGLITEAWYALFVHQYSEALRASERALAILPQDLAAAINHAHALMLMDRTYEAKAAYLAHRGETIDDKVWRKATKEDFDKLRKIGITHPLMGEIEAAFAPPAPVVETAPPASSPPVAKAAPPPAPEEAPVWRAAPKAEIFATINTTELKLRACAEFAKQCPEVARMRQGLRVKVLGDAGNGWVKLLVPADDGKIVEGFCNSKYLQYENNEKIGGGLY